MASESRESLKSTLIANYRDLLVRLTRQFGSREVAEDALQDTWLQLERAGKLDHIRNKRAFILRIAFNLVRNRLKYEKRNVPSDEQIEQADGRPDPERTVQARADLARLIEAMKEMPRRRQQVFLMAWRDGLSPAEIAPHFGLSARMIQIEIAKAREHCAQSLKIKNKPEKDVRENHRANVLEMKPSPRPEDKT